MTLPAWTREPLVHFLIAGSALFALLGWRGEPVDPASRVIEVEAAEQAQLALQFERTMGRAPTDAELDAQIERFVRDEVLYREALRLGLDQGDAVVRRRLVSKMDMSASAAAEAAEPDQTMLEAFYEENRERYRSEIRVSFDQIFFGENDADAWAATKQINRGRDIETLGIPTSLPRSFERMTIGEAEARFGRDFATSLARIEPSVGNWKPDMVSGFGYHIVLVRERDGGDVLAFKEVRDRVENDWRSAEIASRKERAFKVLRDAYRVEIDR